MKIRRIILVIAVLNLCFFIKSVSQSNTGTLVINFPENPATSVVAICPGLSYVTGSDTIILERIADNSWSKTITDIPAGFYYYQILIDGAPVYDQASYAYLGWGTWVNAIEVADTSTFSEQLNGPFGNINQHYYKSKVLNEYRRCYVYTPEEYDANPGKNYPVIYLLQDSGEIESAWLYQGKINNIMDNAINNDLIEPILIVLENRNAFKHNQTEFSDTDFIDEVIITDLVPFIDSIYNTIDTTTKRAIAGCNYGGVTAINIALKHRDIFGSLGVFSLPSDIDTTTFADSIQTAGFDLLVLGAGVNDPSFALSNDLHQKLIDRLVIHEWDTWEGSNNWLVWRKNLLTMLLNIFK